ncbi:hypothetical protein Tco_0548274, partial [Tanacetum coccineum]
SGGGGDRRGDGGGFCGGGEWRGDGGGFCDGGEWRGVVVMVLLNRRRW